VEVLYITVKSVQQIFYRVTFSEMKHLKVMVVLFGLISKFLDLFVHFLTIHLREETEVQFITALLLKLMC